MIARVPLPVPLLALAGLLVLAVLVLTGWPPLDRADHAVSEAFRAYGDRRPALVATLRILTDVAATIPFLVAGGLATLVLAVRRDLRAAAFCALVTAVVPVCWGAAHWLLHNPRPVDGFVTVTTNGFPSGHTSNAAAAALVVVLLAWPRLAGRGRTVLVTGAAVFAVFVGLTRVALLAHWPTDVLGGWLLASIVVPLAAYLLRGRTARVAH